MKITRADPIGALQVQVLSKPERQFQQAGSSGRGGIRNQDLQRFVQKQQRQPQQ